MITGSYKPRQIGAVYEIAVGMNGEILESPQPVRIVRLATHEEYLAQFEGAARHRNERLTIEKGPCWFFEVITD